MSIGPVPGGGIAVALPVGKTVFWAVTVQAAYDQFVQLTDSQGDIIFVASGGSPGGHSPTQIGHGSFVAQDPQGYRLYVGTNGGQAWSSVIWDSTALEVGGVPTSTNYNFISEDGADQDFNDSHVSITWFETIG
ncbi:hypothetical protein [Brevundimonas sp.]|jgi:hypothetical protein|uniref:hypothetical protein n=1 Tax=Brevundimonas sp. TaxID=1871086 RepID=UPI0037BFF2C6